MQADRLGNAADGLPTTAGTGRTGKAPAAVFAPGRSRLDRRRRRRWSRTITRGRRSSRCLEPARPGNDTNALIVSGSSVRGTPRIEWGLDVPLRCSGGASTRGGAVFPLPILARRVRSRLSIGMRNRTGDYDIRPGSFLGGGMRFRNHRAPAGSRSEVTMAGEIRVDRIHRSQDR